MNSTQGVLEAVNSLFLTIEGNAETEGFYFHGQPATEVYNNGGPWDSMADALLSTGEANNIPAGALYVMQLAICINDYIKRPGMIDALLQRPRVFKQLTPAAVRKYAAMKTADFAQLLYDVCTDKGRKLTPADDAANGHKAPIMMDRCLYAAYIYAQVAAYLDKQNASFLSVPMPNGIMQLPWINTGIRDIDTNTGNGTIIVGDTIFRVKKGLQEVSTGALMLVLYLLYKARSTGEASLSIPLREYAEVRGRSTSKQAIQKLKTETTAHMEELAILGYDAITRINGKAKNAGHILINGGTHIVENGAIHWNFNQDLYNQLMIYAPTDTPLELFTADPRTSTFYFGMYIAQNRRLNEDKPGRDKIPMRTLVEKSPNLPTYEEVMKGNRNVSDRIIKKAFADLDALDTLYYDFYTAAGERVENPDALDYQTFINGYILVDYSEYPQHPDRVKKSQEHRQKMREAKEKGQLLAATKAAENAQ